MLISTPTGGIRRVDEGTCEGATNWRCGAKSNRGVGLVISKIRLFVTPTPFAGVALVLMRRSAPPTINNSPPRDAEITATTHSYA